jgi:hypothetical protein
MLMLRVHDDFSYLAILTLSSAKLTRDCIQMLLLLIRGFRAFSRRTICASQRVALYD